MQFSERTVSGVTVLDLKGKIMIGVGDVALREAVRKALDEGKTKILINMEGVTTMDSSGIGELVHSYTSTANRGGRLKLTKLPPKISDILHITQLITIFDVFENETEAVQSFS